MADPEHLVKLREGADAWNEWRVRWRESHPKFLVKPGLRGGIQPVEILDLSHADLHGADLREADLHEVKLDGADLRGAYLCPKSFLNYDDPGEWPASPRGANLNWASLKSADLRGANLDFASLSGAKLVGAKLGPVRLREATLIGADLRGVNLGGADLCGARLSGAKLNDVDLNSANLAQTDLTGADLAGASLRGADLTQAMLVDTNLEGADLTGCRIHGISAWDLRLEGAIQANLVISRSGEPVIEVDSLEVAQFLYLLLNNVRVRQVIDTITSKVVLILGRFTPERKAVLDALREKLRQRDYLPVLFDFEKPASRDLTETISTLAHLARFVIADITDAKSIPQELERIVPDLPSVPVQPLLLASQHEYGMFEHFRRYSWVLEPVLYEGQNILLAELEEKIIAPAEAKVKEQTGR